VRLAGVGVWEWDLVTGEVEWSDTLFEILGLSPSSRMSLEEVRARIHPDDLPIWEESIRSCLEDGVEHCVDIRLRGHAGRARWMAARGNVERDAQGRPRRMVGAVMDITDRKQAEAASELDAERYRSLIERTSEGFYLVEWDKPIPVELPIETQLGLLYRGRIVECNDVFAGMYGFDGAKQMIGRSVLELHGSDDDPENVAFLRACIESGYELRGVISKETDREGRTVWFSNSLVGIVRDGKLLRVWGTQTDVTEIREAEYMVSRERNLSELVIEGLPGLFYLIDANGRFIRWNRKLTEAAGRSDDEMPELHPLDLFEEDEKALVQSRIREVFETGSSQVEASMVSKSGERTPFLLTGQRVEVDGRPMLVGVGLDLTEQRRLERIQLDMQTRLDRAHRLESIGRLAGGVAHDLNNLLSPILGYAELLQDSPRLDDEERESVAGVLNSSLKARDLVRQLLAFGRRQTMAFENVDLNELVRRFEPLLRRAIPEDVDLKLLLQDHIPPVLADAVQIEQVLMNLVINGADAMRRGGCLVVSTKVKDLESDAVLAVGRYVVLEVRDDGDGMDEVTMGQIFEPFFSTKGSKGHGMGLATVYGIAKQHGGQITVESRVDEGSCFNVFLPAASNGPSESAALVDEVVDEVRGSETILVVEDDPDIRRLLVGTLRRYGYRVFEAPDGATALGQHADIPLDLLLTDVVMPGMNGVELAEILQARQPRLEAIFMSGYADEVMEHRGAHRDRLPILQKPFTIRSLLAFIRKVLDDSAQTA